MPARVDAGGADEGRSDRKRRVILEAATDLFLRNGYLGTSMDEVASVAGVSKQTVYKHFSDKEGLFQELVLATIDQVGEPFYEALPSLEDTDDVEEDLRALARGLIRIVMRPRLLQLRRLVIAEAGRFPELGRAYYERGPGRTAEALASHLEQLARRGLLRVDDPSLAANHFLWLVVSIPLNAVMFGGSETQFTPRQLNRFADTGASAFLEGYRSA
jgi:TetR/AcrR family transcriptional repressor of mexJK operon